MVVQTSNTVYASIKGILRGNKKYIQQLTKERAGGWGKENKCQDQHLLKINITTVNDQLEVLSLFIILKNRLF